MASPAVTADRVVTHADLRRDLGRMLRPGDTVLVHASLSRIGYVVGGAWVVVHALLDVLGPTGTLVVPAQTLNRDPSRWGHEEVPKELHRLVRDALPAFDPETTPTHGMGAIAESVRVHPRSVRSHHPQTSFCAIGEHARELMARHELHSHLGPQSPLAGLAALSAKVLLLGVGWEKCTAFHLAEYRLPDPPIREYSCAVLRDGRREWITFAAVGLNDSDFADVGRAYEAESRSVAVGRVGGAEAKVFPLTEAVDHAERFFRSSRPRQAGRDGGTGKPAPQQDHSLLSNRHRAVTGR